MHSFTWVKGVMRASHRQEEGKKSTKKVLRNFFNEPEEELLRSLQVIFSIEKCNCFPRVQFALLIFLFLVDFLQEWNFDLHLGRYQD